MPPARRLRRGGELGLEVDEDRTGEVARQIVLAAGRRRAPSGRRAGPAARPPPAARQPRPARPLLFPRKGGPHFRGNAGRSGHCGASRPRSSSVRALPRLGCRARRRGRLEERDAPAAAALVHGDERVHGVAGPGRGRCARRDHPGVRESTRHPGGHRPDRPDDADVGGGLVAAEDLAEVGGDGQAAAVVGAVVADDVAVVREAGRDGRTAAPVPAVEEGGRGRGPGRRADGMRT